MEQRMYTLTSQHSWTQRSMNYVSLVEIQLHFHWKETLLQCHLRAISRMPQAVSMASLLKVLTMVLREVGSGHQCHYEVACKMGSGHYVSASVGCTASANQNMILFLSRKVVNLMYVLKIRGLYSHNKG